MKLVDKLVHLERTTSLDAGFLTLEGPATPMHIGSLTYLEAAPLRDRQGRIRLGDLRRLVEERLSLAPRFRQRPVPGPLGLGRPIWVDDPHFEVANHVNEVVLPPPGSEQQLRELVAQLMMRLLDRSRPLWELWVVDGLADGNVALVEKVHHVMMDGVSGVDVVMLLTDDNPATGRRRGRAGTPAPPKAGPGRPGTLPLLLAGAADELGVPLALAGMPFRLARLAAGALAHPSRLPALKDQVFRVGEITSGSLSLIRRNVIAPRTALNEPVTNARTYDHVEWPLEAAQAVARSFGCTLNDVLLTAVTGGVRQLLLS
ncbi:MAG TPA: wax ester/triacylglycerol synthase domain-containing protein, partial [Acidimicrobiales bacterium]|nr:wax ester/triacylglycerol synthase domain-containing protein [Acidimicrobiales bacterium]